MGMQETAEDVLHLVQALAQGKTLEYRVRKEGSLWHTYKPATGELGFTTHLYEYRIKRDLREELFDLVRKYGQKMYHAGVANAQSRTATEKELRATAKEEGEKIELFVDLMLGEKK